MGMLIYACDLRALIAQTSGQPQLDADKVSAARAVNAARDAMNGSHENGGEAQDVAIPSHLAAALSLALDDHEAAMQQEGQSCA